ncbi:MAG: hypothetical protein QOI26_622 [Pseudonocardiales bacterium]|nr:hypothetical protein [Pseudonocardiales bacterium]
MVTERSSTLTTMSPHDQLGTTGRVNVLSVSTAVRERVRNRGSRTSASGAFRALASLSAIAILLQGLWAGIFLEHDGKRDNSGSWIDVHARGGEAALALAAVALVIAFVRLRSRRDLMIGSATLVVLLAFESYLGGLIRDQGKDTLTAVHVPLALAIMALAVWLPVRSRQEGLVESTQ